MKEHVFSWMDFEGSIPAPTNDWTFVWVDALYNSTLYVYFRYRQEQTLDGMYKTITEEVACITLTEDLKWRIMVPDEQPGLKELEPGKFYDTSDQAFVVVENHNFKLS